MITATDTATIQLLRRPEGEVAFEVRANGPLIVCVPGMGELRTSTRVFVREPSTTLPSVPWLPVTAPSLIVMGQQDPDVSDPALEAAWIGQKLHADVVMVPEAGHHPQPQRPDPVGRAVIRFARQICA